MAVPKQVDRKGAPDILARFCLEIKPKEAPEGGGKSYADDPVGWVRDKLGEDVEDYQAEALESVRDNPRTTVGASHGVGKSWVASRAVAWFMDTFRPARVMTTASSWNQVEKVIWAELQSLYAKAKARGTPLAGEMLQTEWKDRTDPKHFAFGFSPANPGLAQGFHEENVLVVVDEAGEVQKKTLDVLEAALTSGHVRLLYIGNTTDPTGPFAASHKDKTFYKIMVPAFRTPNFAKFGLTTDDFWDKHTKEPHPEPAPWKAKVTGPLPRPWLVTPEWVWDKVVRWRPDSPLFKSRIMAEFPEGADDSVLPLSWITAAMKRTVEPGFPWQFGVDVSDGGGDNSVIAPRRGNICYPLILRQGMNTNWLSGRVAELLRGAQAEHQKLVDQVEDVLRTATPAERQELERELQRLQQANVCAAIDKPGVGAGVVNPLQADGLPAYGVNTGESPVDKDRFFNLRAELWWTFRERLDPDSSDPIALPDDPELLEELSAPKFRYTSKQQIQLEPKDETKKRLGRSPDRADAVILAWAPVAYRGAIEFW